MVALWLAVALGRPNALDREVDALSAHALLAKSPLSLIDPARAAAAAHLEQMRIPVWIVMVAAQIAVLAWFWSAGYSARLRDALRAAIGSEFAVRFCFGAALALLDRLVAFVPQVVQYRFSRIMDLSNQLLRVWIAEWIVATLAVMIAAGLIAAVVLWLADRTHQWYLYTIAGVVGVTLLLSYAYPVVAAPAYAHVTPYHSPRVLAADEIRLQRRTGVSVPLLESHVESQTRVGSSYVEGWGGTQRIVVSDTLLAAAGEPELRYAIARGYAWVAANTGLHLALVRGAIAVLGAALAVLISDRIGFRRDDDPVSRLALLGAILGCVYVIALPFYNGFTKNIELQTDRAAVALTGDRAAAVRAQIRQADQALIAACPNAFAYWYLSSEPAPAQRIALLQGRPESSVCLKQP